jgi:hypothetical protein
MKSAPPVQPAANRTSDAMADRTIHFMERDISLGVLRVGGGGRIRGRDAR